MRDVAVIGGGILGLAAARELVATRDGVRVTVYEKEAAVGRHQTGNNSGVVHAGLYYEPGSLKARLCRQGGALVREYCATQGLPYEACGKVVVATEESELPRLHALRERAGANGVPGIRLVDADELRALEPHAAGLAALHSPDTAITDYGAIARRLAEEIVSAGGTVRTGVSVDRVVARSRGAEIWVDGRQAGDADRALVCAGLQSDRLAARSGVSRTPRIVPFRGEYLRLRADRAHLVRGLIYPVPEPGLPFLGVHLTRKVDGSVWVGPNAVLALAREGYARRDVAAADVWETITDPGALRLFRAHWRVGLSEVAGSASRRLFVHRARRYLPALGLADVEPAPAGVRAQAVDPDGSLVDDFRLAEQGRVLWVRNAPSPAATSSFAIAGELVSRLAA